MTNTTSTAQMKHLLKELQKLQIEYHGCPNVIAFTIYSYYEEKDSSCETYIVVCINTTQNWDSYSFYEFQGVDKNKKILNEIRNNLKQQAIV